MSEKKKTHPCPTCQGKKVIDGICESSPEWPGTENEDGVVCTPETECPTCKGTGVEVVDEEK